MSTKATLAHHKSHDGKPSWHLYEEILEADVVYLQIEGVAIDFTTLGNLENPPGTVVLRLPIETAKQLGMHSVVATERWEIASDADKLKSLEKLRGSPPRSEDPSDSVG